MQSTKSTIAIIGGGRWGHVTLSEFIKVTSPFTNIVSVCGHNADSIDSLLAKLSSTTEKKLSRCSSIEELLQQHKLDAAIIVNSPKKHYETAVTLLDNDIPLLIEKPIVLETIEAQDLVDRARSRGIALVPALNYGHLEYLKNFSQVVLPKKDKITGFTFKWTDPPGKFRFFQDVKKASNGISFIQEVMPHHWTMMHVVFAADDIQVIDRENSNSNKKHIYRVTADGIPGTIIINEEAPERLRQIEVEYTDQEVDSIIFTDEPGTITSLGKQTDACPNWTQLKSPLVQEYEYFVTCLGKPISAEDAAGIIESTRFTFAAYSFIEETV